MDNDLKERLEFAAREYGVATNHLLSVLAEVEEIPPRIRAALLVLVNAINEEWN